MVGDANGVGLAMEELVCSSAGGSVGALLKGAPRT